MFDPVQDNRASSPVTSATQLMNDMLDSVSRNASGGSQFALVAIPVKQTGNVSVDSEISTNYTTANLAEEEPPDNTDKTEFLLTSCDNALHSGHRQELLAVGTFCDDGIKTRMENSSSPEIPERPMSHALARFGHAPDSPDAVADDDFSDEDAGPEIPLESEQFPYLFRLENEYKHCAEEYEKVSLTYEDGEDEDPEANERACDRIESLRSAKMFARERLITYCQKKNVKSKMLDPELTSHHAWKGSDSRTVNSFMSMYINARLKPEFEACLNMVRNACKAERWGQTDAENHELARNLIHEIHVCVDNVRRVHYAHSIEKYVTDLGDQAEVDPATELLFESTLDHARSRWDQINFSQDDDDAEDVEEWCDTLDNRSGESHSVWKKPKFWFVKPGGPSEIAVNPQSRLLAAVQQSTEFFTPRRITLQPAKSTVTSSESNPLSHFSDRLRKKFCIKRRPVEEVDDTDGTESTPRPAKKRKCSPSISSDSVKSIQTFRSSRPLIPFVQIEIPVTVIPVNAARFSVRIRKN